MHDTPIVVTASGYDPEISVHNLDTGERIGPSVHGRGLLASLELGEVDGSPVIVAGHWNEPYYDDKQIWVWDLAAGEQLIEPFGHQPLWREYHGTSDLAIAELNGDPVVVSGDLDAKIRVWDLRTGDLLVGAGTWW